MSSTKETEERVGRELVDVLAARAAAATPGRVQLDEVQRRAVGVRRRRQVVRAVVVAALVVVVGAAALAAVGARRESGTVASDGATVPALAGPDARWAVIDGYPRYSASAGVAVAAGPRTFSNGLEQRVEPYLALAAAGANGVRYDGGGAELLYHLTGDRWTAGDASFMSTDPASHDGGSAGSTVITGTAFDPSRLTLVEPRPSPEGVEESSLEQAAALRRRAEQTPEELIAQPSSRRPEVPVEHLGAFDWVVFPAPASCTDPLGCGVLAVGGDDQQVVVIGLAGPVDWRAALASLRVVTAEQLGDPVQSLVGHQPGGTTAEAVFFTALAARQLDDSPWPAEVPTDLCTAFRTWLAIQRDSGGAAYGTPGWERWTTEIAAGLGQGQAPANPFGAIPIRFAFDTMTIANSVESLVADGTARCP